MAYKIYEIGDRRVGVPDEEAEAFVLDAIDQGINIRALKAYQYGDRTVTMYEDESKKFEKKFKSLGIKFKPIRLGINPPPEPPDNRTGLEKFTDAIVNNPVTDFGRTIGSGLENFVSSQQAQPQQQQQPIQPPSDDFNTLTQQAQQASERAPLEPVAPVESFSQQTNAPMGPSSVAVPQQEEALPEIPAEAFVEAPVEPELMPEEEQAIDSYLAKKGSSASTEALAGVLPESQHFSPKEAGKGLLRGAGTSLGTALQFHARVEEIIPNEIAGAMGKIPLTPGLKKKKVELMSKIGSVMEEGVLRSYAADPERERTFLESDIPEGLGNLAAMAATGPGALVVGFGAEGEDAYRREVARQEREGIEPDPDLALGKALGYAAIATAIESWMGVGRLLRKFKTVFGGKNTLKLAERMAKKGMKKKVVTRFIQERLKDGAAGFTEEATQRFTQDMIVEGEADGGAIFKEGAVGGTIQAIAGGGGAVLGQAHQSQKAKQDKAKQAKTDVKPPPFPADPPPLSDTATTASFESKPTEEVKAEDLPDTEDIENIDADFVPEIVTADVATEEKADETDFEIPTVEKIFTKEKRVSFTLPGQSKVHKGEFIQEIDDDTVRIRYKDKKGDIVRDMPKDLVVPAGHEIRVTAAIQKAELDKFTPEEQKQIRVESKSLDAALRNDPVFYNFNVDPKDASATLKSAREDLARKLGFEQEDIMSNVTRSEMFKKYKAYKESDAYKADLLTFEKSNTQPITVNETDIPNQSLVLRDGEWYKATQTDEGVTLQDGETIKLEDFDNLGKVSLIVQEGDALFESAQDEHAEQTAEKKAPVTKNPESMNESEMNTRYQDEFSNDADVAQQKLADELNSTGSIKRNYPNGNPKYAVTRSTKDKTKLQYTTFSEDGVPFGDIEYPLTDKGIKDLISNEGIWVAERRPDIPANAGLGKNGEFTHTYKLRLRDVDIGTIPFPKSAKTINSRTVEYPFLLTAEDIAKYELTPVSFSKQKKVPVTATETAQKDSPVQEPAKDAKVSPAVAESPTETITEPTESVEEKESRAFKNKRLKKARELANLPEMPKIEKESIEGVENEVIESGMVDEAEQIASDIIADESRAATTAESIAMEVRLEELEVQDHELSKQQSEFINEGEAAKAKALEDKRNIVLQAIDNITVAGQKVGNRLGKWLRARKYNVKTSEINADRVVSEATKAKGAPLTQKEADHFRELTEKIREAGGEVSDRVLEAEEALEKRDKSTAAKNISKESKAIKRRRKSDKLAKERENLKAQLNKAGVKTNDITGAAKIGADVSIILGKLAKNYIEDGATTLQEVSDRMIADVPALTERDVLEIMSNRSTGQLRKAQKEATRILRDLKTQARLTLEIDDAINGVFKTPKSRGKTSMAVKKLQRKLSELRMATLRTVKDDVRLQKIMNKLERVNQQLDIGFRDIKDKAKRQADPKNIAEAKKALKEAQAFMRTTDSISSVEEQLRTKNFDVAPARQAAIQSERLETAKIKLKRLRADAKDQILAMRPRSKGQKVFDFASGIGTGLRTMLSTGEMSGLGRQGMGVISHELFSGPKGLKNIAVSIARAINATFSSQTAEAMEMAWQNDPFQIEREKAGLELTSMDGPLNSREEAFINKWMEKIPVAGHVFKGANRNMVTLLNSLRIGAFDDVVKANPQWSDAQKATWAKSVNALSGRSSLGKLTSPTVMKAFALIGFAPNFAVSRIEAPIRIVGNLFQPGVRKEAAKTIAGFITLQATFYALAALAGGKIGKDPEEFDFGRVSFGNTKIDILAGFNQPGRVATISFLNALDKLGARKAVKNLDPLRTAAYFIWFKQSPLASIFPNFLFGEDTVGRATSRYELLWKQLAPLFISDIIEASQVNPGKDKAKVTAITGGATFFGASSVSIPNALLRPNIRRIYKSRGVASISKPDWPEWVDDRKYIRQKENMNRVFYAAVANKLVENEGYIDSLSKEDAKKYIQSEASAIRKDMKEYAPQDPPKK